MILAGLAVFVADLASAAAAAFDVRTFRPWTGYAIPNGLWLTGDINGDGRIDIVHVVQGRDYVHTWRSNGSGTYAVGTFRPWAGYAMPNGLWMTADLNADGKDDLVHAVQGRDYVHTWLSNGDGTFRVGTFRPWAGYAIPNGLWRVVDFDADGRDDIVHIVAGRDYVHTWQSRGDGTFAVGTFRPWAGYAMPNGLWLAGGVDADGKGDLVHAVQGRDYVHTWLSNGNGTFRVGTFSPWAGYAIPNGLWLPGDHNGDGKTDIVHAVDQKDYVHPWLSTLPRPGEFYLEGLEVAQAVQNMAHSVPLIANKATIVRAYPSLNATTPRAVRGRLWMRNLSGGSWQLVNSLNTVTVNPSENGNLRAKREDAAKSLNFTAPAGTLGAGTLVAWFADLSDAGTGSTVACSDCPVTNRVLAIQNSPPLRLRVVGLRYAQGTPPVTHQPQPVDFTLVRSWLRRAYPISDLTMTNITVPATATAPFGCGDANVLVAAIRNTELAQPTPPAGVDRRTHYYGLVYDAGFFMRGCAAGIPGTPSPGTVASGPTGPGTWGWDTDGSYGDWYTGHELGHTLGRFHIGSGCGETADDPSYPYPSGQISGNEGDFVGLDVGDAANAIPMRALPGTAWRDVMSYCANQWLSDYTYTRIRTRLQGEDALPAGPAPAVAGAEIAPAAGPSTGPDQAIRASLAGPPEVAEGASLPPVEEVGEGQTAVMVTPALAPIGELAPAGLPPLAPPPAYPHEPAVVVGAAGPAPEAGGPVPPEEAVPPGIAAPAPAAPSMPDRRRMSEQPAPQAELRQGDFLTVLATVNLTRKTGKIDFVHRLPQALVVGAPAETDVELRALDAGGDVIASYPVPFLPNTDREPGEDLKGIVDAAIPFPQGAQALELVIDEQVADRFSAPAPGSVPARAEARIEERPRRAEGVTVEGELARLNWSDAGPAPEGVSYDVQASSDGGRTWQTVAIGLKEPMVDIDLSQFGRTGTLELRVIANSGFSSTVLDRLSIDLARG